MRENLAFTAFDKVLIAKVFAKPGIPSRRMCPLDSRAISRFSTRCFCPTMTFPISMESKSTKELSFWILSFSSLMLTLSI